METKTTRFFALALVLAAVVSCRAPDGTARGAVEEFLDAHYVNIDLQASRLLVSGLALRKIDDEIALVEGLEPVAQSAKPRIGYRLMQTREGDGEVTYLYELTIAPSGSEPFGKEVIVTARSEHGQWKVSNYSEADKTQE